MILREVCERFVAASPIAVMARAALEDAWPPAAVDALFADVAQRQDTRDLLLADVVDLRAVVACRGRPSINTASKTSAQALGVPREAVDHKINGMGPPVGAALVRRTAAAGAPVLQARGGRRAPWRPGYRAKILDGGHRPGPEHRLKPLRTERTGALPGPVPVVFDPESMLVLDAIPGEDGHAQERSRTDPVPAAVRPGDLGVGDRYSCTTASLFGIVARGGSFVIRQHGSTRTWAAVGPREAKGRGETGAVSEQSVRRTGPGGEPLVVRRVAVDPGRPTRDGDREIRILTDRPEGVADAVTVADLDRERRTPETASQEIEATPQGAINALGDPRAAPFALCVAPVAYDVTSAIKGALRSVRGSEAIDAGASGSDLAAEVAGTTRGMGIAIPEDEGTVFHGSSASERGRVLQDLARRVRRSHDREPPRGPKEPKPKKASGYRTKHLATAKRLKDQQPHK